MNQQDEQLLKEAQRAYANAYAPYSKFQVGAALLLKSGEIILGANVENASYGLTNCAERSALFTAYSKGYRREDIEAMAITANCERPVSPCGACRQVMSELMPKQARIILSNIAGDVKEVSLQDLLPYTFTSEDL